MRYLFIGLVCLLAAGPARAQYYDNSSRPIITNERELQLRILENINRRLNKIEGKVFASAHAKAMYDAAAPSAYHAPTVPMSYRPLQDAPPQYSTESRTYYLTPGQSVTIRYPGGHTTISVHYGR
jgi:hypothetical protein